MIKDIIRNKYELVIRDNYIHIKYYKRIIDIDCKQIIVMLDKTKLIINGSNLVLSAMDEYELLINGCIREICFLDE